MCVKGWREWLASIPSTMDAVEVVIGVGDPGEDLFARAAPFDAEAVLVAGQGMTEAVVVGRDLQRPPKGTTRTRGCKRQRALRMAQV